MGLGNQNREPDSKGKAKSQYDEAYGTNFNSLQEAVDFRMQVRKEHPWMIDPRKNKNLAYWDGVTSVRCEKHKLSSGERDPPH